MELAELGKQPILPDQPAGEDVRYDPLFEELQAEVDKFSSPSASGAVEWDKIVKLSSDILSRKSKDLLVASYLAVALVQTRKFEGVEIGSRIYRDLVELHWDALFPAKARMRGRIAAIQWWAEKAEGILEQIPKGPYAQERIDALNENLQTIDRLLAEYLEEPPSIRTMLDFAASLEAIESPPDAEPAAAAPASGTTAGGAEPVPAAPVAAPGAPQAAPGPAEIDSVETAYGVLENALREVFRVAEYLRGQDPSNPSAYRLTRVAARCGVEALPPSGEGNTGILAPYTMDVMRDLAGEGREAELVAAAERNLEQHAFWLDLDFWTWRALARLGEGYQAAAEAVRQETGLFLRRLPGIEDLKFSDGTPFASEETREWIKGLKAEGGGGGGDGTSTPADPSAGGVRHARALISEGRAADAFRAMQKGVRGAASRKDAFLWRIAFCRLLAETPEPSYALPHIDEILREVDLFRLEEFDPDLALKGLKAAWDGYRVNAGAVPEEKVVELQRRIARLDVAAAMSLAGD